MYPQQMIQFDQNLIDKDAADLHKAMKGAGTDEDAIIRIVAHRTNPQRMQMIQSYRRQFNKDLVKELKSELSGNLENAIEALFTDPCEYDAIQLYKAMKGLGTNEDTLIEILATRPNWMIQKTKEIFRIKYNKDLIDWVKSETSGGLKKVLCLLINCVRIENAIADPNICKQKSDQLYKAGEDRLGTNEEVFYKIFTESSPYEINLINQIYTQDHKHDLIKAVDKEFSGDTKRVLQAIVYAMVKPSEFFAKKINKAVKGLGTKDNLLIRVIVSRFEFDMPQIKESYRVLFGKNLIDDVKSDTSGDYKKLLVELLSN